MVRNTRKGFTLIELLIVVVIIGILAAIAIPRFANTKEKAYLASMKSDLRNLATAQEAYFSDNQVYIPSGAASNLGSTPVSIGNNYVPSSGVTITIASTSGTAWSATGTHSGTTKTCAIFIGGSVVAPATVEGEPRCDM
ncbi:MAG TPA: type II secretion system protein [Gemmatimonadaceae bacterium]|nr:type II secretion system protein [Gemmatimonadaceae bacterium]